MFLCLIGFLHDIVLDIAVGSFISSSSMNCSEIALSALDRKGIRAYGDDINLPRGGEIGPELLKAI